MVMRLSSGVGLGFYANHGKRNSTFQKSSYRKTRLLNCRVSEPPSHQQISEDITWPFRNWVFKLTRPLAYRVIINYPNIKAHARVCLFQLHYPGSERESFHCLRVNKFVCRVGIFLLTISSLSLTSSCGPLIICCGTSLLTGISQLWLHLDWLFSIVGHYLLTMILTLYVYIYIYICMYVVVYIHTYTHICRYTHI